VFWHHINEGVDSSADINKKIKFSPKQSVNPPHRGNRTLLGYHAASSGNFLPTFRENLSVPSSGVNNPHRASAKPVLRSKHADTESLNLLCVFYDHTGVRTDCSQKRHNIKKREPLWSFRFTTFSSKKQIKNAMYNIQQNGIQGTKQFHMAVWFWKTSPPVLEASSFLHLLTT
jgi:hypothetical protein